MDAIDTMPVLVREFAEDGTSARRSSASYASRREGRASLSGCLLCAGTSDAVDDLGNRAFSVCASVPRGAFRSPSAPPLQPMSRSSSTVGPSATTAYAKLAITREIMRDDYAFNLRRDPVLRWRAEPMQTSA